MKFLKLTQTDGVEVFVNPAHIVHVKPSGAGADVLLSASSLPPNTPYSLEVRESPEEILRGLKEI